MIRAAGIGLAIALVAARANACPPSLHVRGLGPVWTAAADAVRDELVDRDDVDRCAELEVFADHPVRVSVWFEDGRHATRDVASPRDLRATVLALVLVAAPIEIAPLEAVPVEATPPAIPPVAVMTSALAVRAEPRPSTATALVAAVSLGEQWASGDRGAIGRATLHVVHGAWVAGVTAGFARSATTPQVTTTAAELGAEVGRRFVAGVPITLVVGPRVIWLGQAVEMEPTIGPTVAGKPLDSARSAAMLRAGGGAIAQLVATSDFTLALTARASVDVTSDVANRGPYLTPILPEWGFELALEGQVRLWP